MCCHYTHSRASTIKPQILATANCVPDQDMNIINFNDQYVLLKTLVGCSCIDIASYNSYMLIFLQYFYDYVTEFHNHDS